MEILIGILICGLIGAVIGNAVGRSGFWWGFFLGPIGWLVILLLPRPAAPTVKQPASTVSVAQNIDALHKLADLRDRKVITETEFERQRALLTQSGAPSGLSETVKYHLACGDKVAAIRKYREETGCDLQQAKAAVEGTGGASDPEQSLRGGLVLIVGIVLFALLVGVLFSLGSL